MVASGVEKVGFPLRLGFWKEMGGWNFGGWNLLEGCLPKGP